MAAVSRKKYVLLFCVVAVSITLTILLKKCFGNSACFFNITTAKQPQALSQVGTSEYKNGPKNSKKKIIKYETKFINRSSKNTFQMDAFTFMIKQYSNKVKTRQASPSSPSSIEENNCLPVFPQVVLYNRIFKTGSTSMLYFFKKCSKILKNIYLKDYTEWWVNEQSSHPILTKIQNRAKLLKGQRLFATAHFFFRENLSIPVNYTYINIVREPIKRFISSYYYARSPNRWPERLDALKRRGYFNETIEQCLELQHTGCIWNTMTRFFCGPEAICKTGSLEALERAKYNMVHHYTSVGILENLKESVAVLSKLLPDFIVNQPDLLETRFSTTGVEKKPISDSVMAKIITVNKADIELYKFATTLFQRQAHQCGVELKS